MPNKKASKKTNPKDPFDYFICYCGKDMYEDSITKKFAYSLYNKLISCGKKVYLAPETGHGDAYNSDDMIKKMMRNLTTSFIVLLSPNFFNDFDEQDGEYESPRKKELSAALAEAQNRQNTSDSQITDFLKYVHIDGFKWYNSYNFLVRKLFRDYPLNEYFHIAAFDKINTTAKEIVSLENNSIDLIIEETVNLFIKENLYIDINLEYSIEKYRHDMNLCFHCMMAEKQEISLNDFSNYNQEENAICPKRKSPDELISDLGFKKNNKNRLTYWPVFFTDYTSEKNDFNSPVENSIQEKKEINLSTWAICLGALQILHWLGVDEKRDSKDNQDKRLDYVSDYFRNYLDGAIKLIVLTRNEKGAWPEQRCLFGDNRFKDIYEHDNGLNQTTLSISALLKSGFLDTNKIEHDNPEKILKNRFQFLCKSVKWIIKEASKDTKRKYIYWNGSKTQKGSTLMTSMCLDTFIKFLQEPYAHKHMESVKVDFEEIFRRILNFFKNMQNDDGGIRPSMSPNDNKSSFSHTAKVMNSLCAFWKYTNDAKSKAQAKSIINRCFDYLINLLDDKNGRLYNESEQADYEKFNIPNDEFYEMNGELMFVTSIINFISSDEELFNHSNFNRLSKETERKRITNMLIELFNSYRDNHATSLFDLTASESVLIRGRRNNPDEKFPIYILYYYRMALTDLLGYLLCLYKEEKETLSKKAIKNSGCNREL